MDLTLSRYHQARLDLISGVKALAGYRLSPKVRANYERWAEAERVPDARLRDRALVGAKIGRDPLYQASRGLQRITQELMWREVASALEPRRGELEAELDAPGGALTLAPDLKLPGYFTDTEFHLQPGGMWRDKLTGPIYEIGVQHFNLHRFGKSGAEMGLALLEALPKRAFTRFLELGSGPGYKMYPLLDAFPAAEAHGVDLSAPLLKYAHARAKAHGRTVRYAQMNAEALTFPDSSFDLVYDMILLHELPVPAIRNVLREACRVLKQGGVYADLDLPAYAEVDPFTAFMMDWDTDHNGEPFWRGYHELDMKAELTRAGFSDVRVVNVTSEALRRQGNYQGKWSYRVVLGTKP
jgi:ubiquinone/menaquinone biosynthesis C-methylase UbiE